jgi:hypothetical protein
MGRGPDPEDEAAFGEAMVPKLRRAVEELSWLLGRGYADTAAVEVVGNRHQLTLRQRKVVARASCGDEVLARRAALRRPLSAPLAVDGFNQLIGLERALAGGPVFRGRDGALRDLAAVHGTWRPQPTTDPALDLLAARLPGAATWFLDRPVSNAGRLAENLRARAAANGLTWTVHVVDGADGALLASGLPLATGDGGLLQRAPWVDLLGACLPAEAWVVDLG